jgi:hypothetical protein
MLKKIDFKMLVGAICAFTLAIGTAQGVVQNYIHFTGIDNEMGFAFTALFLGVILCFGIKK